MTGRLTRVVEAMLSLLAAPVGADAPAGGWHPAGESDGVRLEWRPSHVGPRAYRGHVTVCTSLPELRDFVTDPSGLADWIAFTEDAHAVPAPPGEQLYYLRTSAPWPFKSRDMVYRLRPSEAADGVRLIVEGVPGAVPERDDAVRMRAAEGEWLLDRSDGRIHVSFELAVDPGRLPPFVVNRRLAATIAGTLDNLAARFPCD